MGQQRYYNYGATGVAELLKGFTSGALTAGVYQGLDFELVNGEEGRFRLTPGYVLLDQATTLAETERTLRRAVMVYEDEPVPLSLGWGAVPPNPVWYTIYITHTDQDITGGTEAEWHVHEHTVADSPPGPWSQAELDEQLDDGEAAVVVGWIYFPGAVPLDGFMWASARPRKPMAWADDSARLASDNLSYQLLTENNGSSAVEVVDDYGDVRTKLTAGALDADWLFQAFVPPTLLPAFPHMVQLWAEVPSLCSVRVRAYPPGWTEMASTLLAATTTVISLNGAQQQPDGYYDGWNIALPSVSADRRVERYTALTNSVELDAPVTAPVVGDAYTLTPVPVFDHFVSNVDWEDHDFGLSADALLLHKLMVRAEWEQELPGVHRGAKPIWSPSLANPTNDNIWNRYWSILITVTSVPNTTVRLGPLSLEKAYRREI